MPRTVMIFAMIVVAVHGLIHFMGFIAYWPVAEVKDLPYKTGLWGGQWEVGPSGMRVFSFLWLLAAIEYGETAFRGTIVDVIIPAGLLVTA